MPRKPTTAKRPVRWGAGYITTRIASDGRESHQARWKEGARWRARTFATAEAAADHVVAVDRGTYREPSTMTVRELIEDYLARHERDWKPNTYSTYRQRAHTHIYPPLGAVKIADLTTVRVQRWLDGLAQALSPETVAACRLVLASALREAVRHDLIPRDVSAGTSMPKPRKVTHTTWTAAHVAMVFRALADEPMWNTLYRLAIVTGMRPGEIRALQWRDVTFDRRDDRGRPLPPIVTVTRTVTRDRDGRRVIGDTTKTGDSRDVALPEPLVVALKRWKVTQAERRLAAPSWDDRSFVFTNVRGTYLAATTWTKFHDRLIASLEDVPDITLHELRHSAATILRRNHAQREAVSGILGHRSSETTEDHYTHVSIDDQLASMNLVLDLLEADNTTTSATH